MSELEVPTVNKLNIKKQKEIGPEYFDGNISRTNFMSLFAWLVESCIFRSYSEAKHVYTG